MEVIQGPKFDFSKFTRPGSIYPVRREEILALDKLFFFFQNTPPRPRNLPRVPTGYLDTRKVHRGQFWFLKVDRTFACLPGSQGREPGSGQSFFFLKIDHLDLGTCHGTEQGTWTHGRFTGNKFVFSKLIGPGCIYPVHREEILAPDMFFIFFQN